jgi:hypothetical protein
MTETLASQFVETRAAARVMPFAITIEAGAAHDTGVHVLGLGTDSSSSAHAALHRDQPARVQGQG